MKAPSQSEENIVSTNATGASPSRLELVLAGGAARGAYEVGVVQYLLDDVARAIGRPVVIDILCGTSVGAINACALAASADDVAGRGDRLAAHWSGLRIQDVVRLSPRGLYSFVRGLFGRVRPLGDGARGDGLFDPTGLEGIIDRAISFPRIAENIRAGKLFALTVSTTHVGSGRTVVFIVESGADGVRYRSSDPTVIGRAVTLQREHALASAAIPLLFPAVPIGGAFYCDGGLRQNVPLSPARRLGADRLVVVSPRWRSISAPTVRSNSPMRPPIRARSFSLAKRSMLCSSIEWKTTSIAWSASTSSSMPACATTEMGFSKRSTVSWARLRMSCALDRCEQSWCARRPISGS